MAFFENQYVQIVFSSVAVYLFIIVAIRLFGKKELSQLSVVDLVFILLISNAVQNAMVGSNASLLGGLTAAAALFIVNFILKQMLFRFPGFSNLIQGDSLMLIYKGKINIQNAAKAKMTMNEIMEALREHGVQKVEDVDLAVLEVDGNISVLSDGYQHQTVRKRKLSDQVLTKKG